MTLFKQLFIGVSLGFLFLLAGIELIYVDNARTYLQEQLTSHSQDAATMLGMVLPEAMETGDKVRSEVTVTAVFDRGYYQSIRVIDLHGLILVSKTLSPTPPNVPDWFASLIKLEAPVAESKISKGWRQLGRVLVSSHPNFAYQELWNNTLETTLWLIVLYGICIMLLRAFLKSILRPLEEIEMVAQSISERNFAQVGNLPKTRELRNVVQAINSLSKKVSEIIEEEVTAANHFRVEAYIDNLTKLDNRRSFEAQMNSILGKGGDLESGVVFMIQLDGFKEFNSARGLSDGNELLKLLSATLAAIASKHQCICACVNWATFAVAKFNIARQSAFELGDEISNAIKTAIAEKDYGIDVVFGCGGAFFQEENITLGKLMALADMATLQSLHSANRLPVVVEYKSDTDESKGSLHWRKLIVEALADDRLGLLAQPVISLEGKARLQYEVMGRLISKEGEVIEAAKYLPMAVRHGLVTAVDKKLIARLIDVLKARLEITGQIAINLSMHSVRDSELMDWMLVILEKEPDLARRLVFEFAEFNVVQEKDALIKFITKIRKLGSEFAVDHFGLHHSSLEYLQALCPFYIKLSSTYVSDLLVNRDNQAYVSSLTVIAKSLNIKVIAVGIEDESLFELLEKLGVYGYQGYVTGLPVRII